MKLSSFVGSHLGSFEVKSGKLVVSDPCYDRATWCAGVLEKVLNGKYNAFSEKADGGDGWGERNRDLSIYHESVVSPHELEFTDSKIHVGVDSGQAGFFDEPEYRKALTEPYLQVGSLEYEKKQMEHSRKQMRKYHEASMKLSEAFKGFTDEQIQLIIQQGEDDARDAMEKLQPQPTLDWYEMCCDKTLSNVGAGVIPGGAVSSSGYGDGGYNCYIAKDSEGNIIAARIVFIGDEEREEDEDFEEGEEEEGEEVE